MRMQQLHDAISQGPAVRSSLSHRRRRCRRYLFCHPSLSPGKRSMLRRGPM